MLCDQCPGSGFLLIGSKEFQMCLKCGGQGVSLSGMVGPTITLIKKQSKFLRSIKKGI